jgi:hypothetical protein
MSRVAGIRIFCITAAIALLTIPIAGAQPPAQPVPAPVPTQILTGKKVFVSNGESIVVMGVPDLTYNEFYWYMKDWGRYELVPTPTDADLVFEIRFGAPTSALSVINRGSLLLDPRLRLAILDPRTRVVLWAFTKQVQLANRIATGRKNFDHAMANLVDDVKKLTTSPVAATGAPDSSNK